MEQRLGSTGSSRSAGCESCAQDVENAVLVIRVYCCSFLRERKRVLPHLYFSLDNSKIPVTS